MSVFRARVYLSAWATSDECLFLPTPCAVPSEDLRNLRANERCYSLPSVFDPSLAHPWISVVSWMHRSPPRRIDASDDGITYWEDDFRELKPQLTWRTSE